MGRLASFTELLPTGFSIQWSAGIFDGDFLSPPGCAPDFRGRSHLGLLQDPHESAGLRPDVPGQSRLASKIILPSITPDNPVVNG